MSNLEAFGKILISEVRDLTIEDYLQIKTGKMKSDKAQKLHLMINNWDKREKENLDILITNINVSFEK